MHNHNLPFQYSIAEFVPGRKQIIDADETCLFDEFFANNKEFEPNPPVVEVPDGAQPVLVYGSFIPQFVENLAAGLDVEDIAGLETAMDGFKGAAHDCYARNKLFRSELIDIELFPEKAKEYCIGIPAAFLIYTSIDFFRKDRSNKRLGFGYSAFVRYSNLSLLSTILNRPYILCLKRAEKTFVPVNADRWKDYIDENALCAAANEIQ